MAWQEFWLNYVLLLGRKQNLRRRTWIFN
jgi:hypothetical protein